MNRRTFLTTTAVGLTLPLVGCLGTTTETETNTPTPSQTPEQLHNLYVVNHTTTTEIAIIGVLDSNGNEVVKGRYELPDERGIEFADIGEWERTYTVELTIDGTDLTPLTWETESCASVDEAPRGSRNGYVQVHQDDNDGRRVSLAVDNCDALVGPTYPTGPARYFRVDE